MAKEPILQRLFRPNASSSKTILGAEARIRAALEHGDSGIDLSGLGLTELPQSIRKLTTLQELILSGNRLTSLPQWFGQFSTLSVLALDDNKLTTLPDSLRKFSQLGALLLARNRLNSLPEWLHEFPRLHLLDLEANALLSLPRSMKRMPALRKLYLYGNPSLSLPAELLIPRMLEAEGRPPIAPSDILDYYFRTRKEKRPINEVKLILVGRGSVGKTCVIKRLIDDSFDEKEQETPGIEIRSWMVKLADGDFVRLHVWDFGGQEILHSTHQFFLTERTIYLLVLSGREGSATRDAEYWLQLIKSFGGDSQVLIALNKSNQHPFDVNREFLLEKYPFIAGFIATDCKDGLGVDALRRSLIERTEAMEDRKAAFPAEWFSIKERLAGSKQSFLRWDNYQAICRELGERDPDAQRELARFLHILGIALNYRDDPRLKETHVLNPLWITEGIYSLLRAGQRARNSGVLTMHSLHDALDAEHYPATCHEFLLTLMEKFELCFRLPGPETRYLVPELLDDNQPRSISELLDKPGLRFRYQYKIIPEGLLPRFIVKTHAHSEETPRWRTGVVLEREGCRAVVRADTQDRLVDIHIAGPEMRRREFLAVVRDKFDEQHRDLKGLEVEELVPVPGEPNVTVSYRHLMQLEEDGDALIKPVGMRKNLRVTELLNGIESPEARKQKNLQASYISSTTGLAQDASIGIIAALPKELVAMKASLTNCNEYNVPGSGAGRRYWLGLIPSEYGGDHVVVLAQADMGNNMAATRATLMMEHFPNVDAILMVGIAGGVPDPDRAEDHVRLGDIVVSDKRGVVQYDMVKLDEVRACPIAPSARLVEAVRSLETRELEGKRPWEAHIGDVLRQLKQKRPAVKTDKLFATNDPKQELVHPRDDRRRKNKPRVFFGPIASANTLLKDAKQRDQLRERFKVKAVEMEGSGIADATWLHERGYLVVRGICDYCDMNKNDTWQEYAAAAAAGYAWALIESMFVAEKAQWRERESEGDV